MRVSKQQAAENREGVLDAAAKLFRERGFDGVGVDAVMAEAGLTHGGFYKSFASKDALVAEACTRAFRQIDDFWGGYAGRPGKGLAAAVGWYLSRRHLDSPGDGCVLAALAADAGRRGPTARAVFSVGLERWVGYLVRLLPGASEARRRDAALARIATMVGAVAIARALDDQSLADEILAAARIAVLADYAVPEGQSR
jgi:TetR/AcrR family transcriptional repressor of nem operon